MDDIDQKKFHKAHQEAENFYKNIEKVFCPYFKEEVAFNAKGLEHLKFSGLRRARSHGDQYIRFRLISLAPRIVKESHTLQGISVRRSMERVKTNSRWESVMRMVTYYEFVAVIKDVRVRVIVKQVEGGQKYFWSVIPFWKMDKMSKKRLTHSGKPETD